MLVVHGFLAGGRLGLWAEDAERRVKSTSQALRSARPHPFASPVETLAALHAGKAGEAVLLLPSLRSAPLDSPELIRVTPRPPARSAPALLAWTVPVVEFDAAAALGALADRVDGVRYGASVDFLSELALFARELAERGRVLPTLAHDDGAGRGAAARWRPVLRGADLTTVHGFVAALPPVCRAVRGGDDPHALVTGGLATLVDAAVRLRLPPGLDLAPPRRGRRPKRLPLVETWLSALSGPDGRLDADPDEIHALASLLEPWDAERPAAPRLHRPRPDASASDALDVVTVDLLVDGHLQPQPDVRVDQIAAHPEKPSSTSSGNGASKSSGTTNTPSSIQFTGGFDGCPS